MHSEAVSFLSPRGHSLAGRLERPLGGVPRGWALLAHCFSCSKDLAGLRELSAALVEAGWGVLRFDFTGLGDSEGEFGPGFSADVDDVVAAARALEAHGGPARLLVGHSLGGTAMLRAAARIESATAVATIAAPADPAYVEGLLGDRLDAIRNDGAAEVRLAGRPFTITRTFLDDLHGQGMREAVAGLHRALLVLHAPEDDTVAIDEATKIFMAARHPKSFVSLAGADHLLSHEPDARFAGTIIATWAARYLPAAEPADAPADHDARAFTHGPRRGYTTAIVAGRHRVLADEPVALGGADRGPTPHQLLLAGLGACTAMTLRMYADRKQWPLRHADVRLHHQRVSARGGEGGRGLERIEREVLLHGPLDAEQRARLVEIAERCPVHRTLTGTLEIVTTDATDDERARDDPADT